MRAVFRGEPEFGGIGDVVGISHHLHSLFRAVLIGVCSKASKTEAIRVILILALDLLVSVARRLHV
jgi:hypothetical protein